MGEASRYAIGYRDNQCCDAAKSMTSMSHQSSLPHTMQYSAADCPGTDGQGAWGTHLLIKIHDSSIFGNELQILHVLLFNWTAGQPANEHKTPAASQNQAREPSSPSGRATLSPLQAHATHACCARRDVDTAEGQALCVQHGSKISSEHGAIAQRSPRLVQPLLCCLCDALTSVLCNLIQHLKTRGAQWETLQNSMAQPTPYLQALNSMPCRG